MNKIWTIEYSNDTGAHDDYFSEWWEITNGEKVFKSESESSAIWLCELLNKLEGNFE